MKRRPCRYRLVGRDARTGQFIPVALARRRKASAIRAADRLPVKVPVPVKVPEGQPGLVAAGTARPSSPVSVFAEDFALLIRTPRRMRIARGRILVLQ